MIHLKIKKISSWTAGLLLVCCLFQPVFGQKPRPQDYGIKSKKALSYFLEGQFQARQRDRHAAIQAFKLALEAESPFPMAAYELAVASYLEKDYAQAKTYLDSARAQGMEDINLFYGAEIYFYNMAYAEAIPLYERYLDQNLGHKNLLKQAGINLRKATFAREALQDTVRFKPENLGAKVNSPGHDYLPHLTADGQLLIFTSRRSGGQGGYDPRLQDYDEDFYVAEKSGPTWKAARNLGPPINTESNDGAASITQDGRMILFTACDRPDTEGSCDLYFAVRQGDQWSEPKNLGPRVNSSYWDSQPCLSHDGKTLYFSSNRPGGQGGRDIWYCQLQQGKWSKAKNLSARINTPGDESSPFLHADGATLYFSSDYLPGFGATDLFISHRQAQGWSEPQNLGFPLNTLAEESNIFVTADGKQAYINSTREGGLGKSDIYTFDLDPRIRPQKATFLRGWVRDSLDQQPLAARIQLIDLASGDTIRSITSDPVDGRFLMSLPLDKEYAAFVEAQGYLFASKRFLLKSVPDDIYFDVEIRLTPIAAGAEVVLQNIFFDTGSFELKPSSLPELNNLLNFLKRNPDLKIEIQGHTDDVGSDDDNLLLSQQRAQSVADFLLEAGIPTARITYKGYGELQPVVPNTSDENRAQNRRTAFKILGI